MNAIRLWEAARTACSNGGTACLLVVVDRQGSAPNGPGAKLIVTHDDVRVGTIGGGASEHGLVERVRRTLPARAPNEVLTLYHAECAPGDKSGMICGGSQTYVLMYLDVSDLPAIEAALAAVHGDAPARLELTPAGIALTPASVSGADIQWESSPGGQWRYGENLGLRDRLTIIGGGHIGLALSRVAAVLDFEITVLDNRSELETYTANTFAHEKRIIDYADIVRHVPEGPHSYVCVMTYGYRPDREVLAQLIHKSFRYLGLLGSAAKIRQVFADLTAAGVTRAELDRVHAPIGVPIGSRTPEEIAISIAAELIRARRVGDEYR